MPIPQAGDVLIRTLNGNQVSLVDVLTLEHVAGPFESLAVAVEHARSRNVRAIWQQTIDDRGRPLGDPFRLPDLD